LKNLKFVDLFLLKAQTYKVIPRDGIYLVDEIFCPELDTGCDMSTNHAFLSNLSACLNLQNFGKQPKKPKNQKIVCLNFRKFLDRHWILFGEIFKY
jgi:hypothetical protein